MKLSEILGQILGSDLLQEKLLKINQGARYGQALFVAGGSGSGKGFAIQKFLEANKFKIFDVDEWKRLFLKIQDLKGKYPELENLELSNPDDVYKLHRFVKDRGIKMKAIQNVLDAANPERLPNVMFDVTLKDYKNLDKIIPLLKNTGYENEDIHIVWVLTDYYIAVQRNQTRKRIVPDDIVLKTHAGAARTMTSLIKRGLPYNIDGSVHVILNNPENTVFFKGPSDDHEDKWVIKDFTYLTIKESGEDFKKENQIMKQLQAWIVSNTPKTLNRANLLDNMEEETYESKERKLDREGWIEMLGDFDKFEQYLRENHPEEDVNDEDE